MKISLRHDLPCTPEQYWEAFFDPDVNEAMYREAIGASSVEIVEQAGDLDSTLTRTLRWSQPIDAPGPIKKLIGDGTTSTEQGTYDEGVWTFTVDPKTPGVKVVMAGTTTAEPTEGGCVRVFDLDLKVKVIGLGKVFERFAESQAREAQDATAEFFRSRFG